MSQIDDEKLATEAQREEDAIDFATIPVGAELVADSLPHYVPAWFARLRAGESGKLPVIIGMVIIAVIFQTLNSKFLTAGNLVNLLVQGAVFMLLAMGEGYVLLLAEIDLSAGFVGGVSGVVTAELVKPSNGWPWWAAIAAAIG